MFIELSTKNLGKLHRSETCSSLRAKQGPRTELANEKLRITINIDVLSELRTNFPANRLHLPFGKSAVGAKCL
ncbi:MAG: hypothetical protein QOH41_3209 [Blastocatellia bacterium]|jgi:hypothetical protein|nr:hypothetical protein [Blastocatellia bacterium]